MATRHPLKQISALKKTRRYRDHIRSKQRKMQFESLEDRRVMATTGPTLVNVLSNFGPVVNGDTVAIAPREITLRFAEGQVIDPATIANGVRITRGGIDRALNGVNDVVIQPGYIGLTDTPREIIVRFADNLPDDIYRIDLVGTGPTPLRDTAGNAVNGGVDVQHTFNLDLGAQIVAIVPQPVRRVGNSLQQDLNKIEVYFNPDLMNPASVQNPAYYKLIDTATGNIVLPLNVQYTAVAPTPTQPGEFKAVLTFATNIPTGTFKLQAGVTDEPNSSIATAVHVAGPVNSSQQHKFATLFLGDNPALSAAMAAADVDFYRFDLKTASPFSASVNGGPGFNAALRLFNSAGVQMGATVNDTTSGIETLTASLAPGTYYLGVSSAGNVAYLADGTGTVPGSSTGSYKLDATFNNAAPLENNGDDSSYANAGNLGVLGAAGQTLAAQLSPQFYNIVWPGNSDDPGHRDLPPEPTGEEHLMGGPDGVQGIQVISYNFQSVYGSTPQGNPLFNAITENQKQRAREIFEIYGRYLGVKFVETAASGFTVVTGDMRAIDPTIPTGPGGVAGLAGSGKAIMDNAEAWGSSEYGGGWFQVALHEIGHLLGLGHSYDLPAITIQGSAETPDTTPGATNPAEPVFPGDHDILHGQTLYRPEGRDIDLYKFQLTEAGRFTAETIAERLSDRPGVNSSHANTVITLYREFTDNGQTVREIVSRNDDYYSSDSFLEIDLAAGTYYVSVTSTGMTGIDPTVAGSGFGGTTDGNYELKLNFAPTTDDLLRDTAKLDGMRDATGTKLDGNLDGQPGGAYEFFFRSGPTIFVDKANDTSAGPNGNGTLSNPYDTIAQALAAATSGQIVRIVGNGGADGNLRTLGDNRPYLVGYDDINEPLVDGSDFLVPANVTVMIDAGAVIKLQRANIDAGTSTQGISRAGGVIQILGTPLNNVQLTSYSNDAIGGDTDGPGVVAAPGDWGGIVFRDDSDREGQNIFLNYVNNANISYGGGKVVVNSTEELFTPIHVVTARPTLTFNRITFSADAAMSADPDSFEDTLSTAAGISVAGASSRIGPEIYGNTVITNSFNGIFVRIRTQLGSPVDVLNKFARFDDTDIVHLISENLHINGTPGGPQQIGGQTVARYDARLRIDPGMIVKFNGTRIEARVGSQLIVEGTDSLPVILTSLADDRYGVGGTFDSSNDGALSTADRGDWGGLMFNANSSGSIDRARVFYAGGEVPIEGQQATFNAVEIHQADVRIANSIFQFNADGTGSGGNRSGRGANASATIFVRGAQPIIVDNIIRGNSGNIISINANSMQATVQADYGRATGLADTYTTLGDNFGPLVRLNRIVNNGTNGMEVRGGVLTTETIWDDTDIAHVVRNQITILNQHTFGGLRLQSSAAESLVVKLFGASAGFLANGVAMDIGDRIGGTLHIVGQANRPVVLTSLADDTVPAGLQPLTGLPLFDTNNNGAATTAQPGDWNSVRLDEYSNDRNVGIAIETEPAYIGAANAANGRPLGDANRVPITTAQFLGNLAPDEKSGDDNRRLGFEVQGFIALDNAHDVDVYSFTANGGSEVWFDIDRTSYGLNVVLELVNGNGTVLARSTDNNTLSGLAQTFQKDPHNGRDFYTVNPKDASMRVILPGTDKDVRYFVRVRSEGDPNVVGAIDDINAGQTRGEYRLQVRVRQVDNKPGSTVRYADIRYATNGIEVIGLPYHSPIGGESTESTTNNNAFANAQHLGNLLTSDRGTIKVSGNLDGVGDVDFFSFDLDYDFLQVIEGVSDAAKTISTIFDIDYADGLSRPDTTISVFNDLGQLVYMGRDSDIQDDQPGAGQGIDSDDLARGSFGKLDPYIGSAQLPAGSAGTAGLPNPQTRRYYVAISSNRRLPTALNAQFQANAASPLIRLEPINSVRRIVEDHLDYTNGSGLPNGAGAPMFDISNAQTLAAHIRTFDFSDATLFTTAGVGLRQIDPYTGATEVGLYGGNDNVRDIVMRNDGRLFGYRWVTNNNTTAGQLVEFNTDSNTWVSRGNDNIADPPQGNTDPDLRSVPNVGALAFTGSTVDGNNHQLYYAVHGGTDFVTGAQFSWLFRADPENGNVRDGNGPLGFQGAITTASTATGTANFGPAQLQFAAAAPGPGGNSIQINFTESPMGVGVKPSVDVTGSVITVNLNTTPATAQANNALGSSVNFQFVAVPAGAAGNGIQLSITKAANVPNGVNATVNGRVINVVIDNANATAQQFADAINGAAGSLVNVTFTGVATTNVGVTAPNNTTITLQGGSPSSAQDVIDAIVSHIGATPATTASNLVTVTGTGNLLTNATPFTPQSVQLAGGDGQVSETTGMAYLDDVMYGVSEAGELYTIFGDGPATLITAFSGVSFTGLTVGPQNVEEGFYSNMLFATYAFTRPDGVVENRIMALDTNGVPQAIFADSPLDADSALETSTLSLGATGLAFSPLDFNLWHTTQFREFQAGHGVNNTPDRSRPNTAQGGTSFYFGLERWLQNPGDDNYYEMGGTGTGNAQLGIMESSFQHMLTNSRTNTTMANTYNFAGGAYGSLVTDGFSLAGYVSSDKPTVYFNYWLETEQRASINNGGMRDAARVWISRNNGVTWELIATNNSQLDRANTFEVDGELPTFESVSATDLPLNPRQQVQELFDAADWRQARIDLSRYAGESNLKFRFDFNTSGDTNLGTIEGAFGNDAHHERGQRNQFGGFAIDDIIVGFAERGEMVSGASANLVDFFAPPVPVAPPHTGPTPNEVLSGSYQLEIRRGTDYGVNIDNGSSVISLYNTYDTNARLVKDVREAAPPPVQDFQNGTFGTLRWATFNDAPWTVVESPVGSGQFRAESGGVANDRSSTLELTADVGSGTITFDWGVSSEAEQLDLFGNIIKPGDRFEFYIDGVLTDYITGNLPTTTTSYTITAGTHNFRWHYVKDGSVFSGLDRGWIDNVAFSNGPQVGYGQLGDENHWRDQGHIQIEQNLITDSANVGIWVDAASRTITGTNLPFQGSVQKMMVPNVDDLLPGVALVNNTIGGYGAAGIRFSGDPNVPGQPVAATPFGRILNNTIWGGATPTGIGIEITDNAGPTVLNNIISNAATAIGVDASSVPTTVIGFNLFKGNTSNGVVGSDGIFLNPADPLFVNPASRNFYLASGSRAIDSSLNSLGERPSYHAVIAELGIPDSPILAPEYDMYGQKRLDDTTQNPIPGQGNQVVKDRGAIERADFTGAFVNLIDPLDNDGAGRDRNTALNDVVVRGNPTVPRFVLKLRDIGIGIDDRAVVASQFTLTENGVPLVLGTDYSFIYNPNTDEITFTPASGSWRDESTYVITVDNTVATGVKDLAGNLIQPNRLDGGTRFTIFIGTPFDYSDAPATYPVARHEIPDTGELFLGAGVTADSTPPLPGQDIDDGLGSNYQLNPNKPSFMEVTASGAGKLDVWIDLDADGNFSDPGEYITGASFNVVAGVNTLSFTMPAGLLGDTVMRLRLSPNGISTPGGDVLNGEVEDHIITLSGPPFQNPVPDGENDAFSRDVNGDGFITALDALIVINYLNLFAANNVVDPVLPQPGLLDDPGTPPLAKYVDVDGDGYLAPIDALIVINWLNDNPIGPSGEGEGESDGEDTSSVTFASAEGESSNLGEAPIPATLYASSSVVIEARESEVDAGEVAAQMLVGDASFTQPSANEQAWDADDLFHALGENQVGDEEDLIAMLAYALDASESNEA